MPDLISTRYPNGVKTHCISFSKLDSVISQDSDIFPDSVNQWLQFDSMGLVNYLTKITGIDWSNCNFYSDEVTVSDQ
tara:strand:- start:318 stop:548 length:231 start_codon:yes stop_codon:yes gene_type:complete